MALNKKEGIVRVGTSNVVIPGNKQTFPEAFQNKSRLGYYASLFNTVEINSSFYKLPMPATFAKWATETGAGFQFSIKLSKEITHIKSLQFDIENVHRFIDAAAMAGNNKGPLLIQFPGKINIAYYKQVNELLEQIRSYRDGKNWRIAVEFRNNSWYIGETMELLNEYNAALVLHDMPKSSIKIPNKSAPFIYIRFHGKKGDYRGSYTNEQLEATSMEIKRWLKKGKDVYVYFNNTIGDAYANAKRLQELVI